MTPTIPGIHHVTTIAGDPQANLDFYVGLLGLRLVKKTVNFDDPGGVLFEIATGPPASSGSSGSPCPPPWLMPPSLMGPAAEIRARGRGVRSG